MASDQRKTKKELIAELGALRREVEIFRAQVALDSKNRQAVAREEAAFRAAYEQSPVGILIFDDQGIITDCNQRMADIAGLQSPQELIGFNLPENLEDAKLKEALRLALKAKDVSYSGWYRTVLSQREIYIRAFHKSIAPQVHVCVIEDLTGAMVKERELLRQKQMLQSLFEHMREGFALHEIILDATGKPVDYVYLDLNPAFEELTGISRERALGRPVTEVIPNIKDLDFDWIATYGAVALTGKPAHFEKYFQPFDRWYVISAYCPEPGYFAVTFQDVTERNRSLRQLEASEQRFRQLAESIDTIFFLNSPEGDTTYYVNPAYERIFDRTLRSIYDEPMSWLDTVHPDDRARVEMELEKSSRNGVYFPKEYRIVRPDGEVRWIKDRVFPVHDRQGRTIRLAGIAEDVTEHRQAEQALKESLDKYHELFELGGDAVFLIDNAGGRILEANTAAEELYGYSRKELLGLKNTDLSAEPDQTRKATLEKGGLAPVYIPIRWHRKKNGEVFPVEITARHFAWKGRPVHVAAIRDVTFRHQAQEQLKAERDRAQRYLDIAGVMIVVLDPQGRATLINRKGCEVLGRDESEILGRNWFESFVMKEDRAKSLEGFGRFLDNELDSVTGFENRARTKSGDARLIRWDKVAVRGKNGEMKALLSSGQDVTEQVRAERALKESEARYRNLVDNAVDGIFLFALSGKIVDANKQALARLGYTEHELLKLHVNELDVLAPGETFQKRWQDKAPGTRQRFEGLHRRKDRTLFPVEINSTKIILGGEAFVLGQARDITERKMAEEALKFSEQMLSFHVQHTPLAYVRCNALLFVEDWNPAAERMFGYDADEAIGRNLLELVVPEKIRENVDHVLDSVILQKGGWHNINENRTKSGEWLVCEWHNTPLLDKDGEVIGVACLAQDITERIKNEEILLQAKDQAVAASRAKSEFLANMSHEIRTPLSGMLTMLELVRDSSLDGEQLKYVETALKSGGNLLALVNDLLNLSQIEAGRVELRREAFSLPDLFASVEEVFAPQAEQKGIGLSTLINEDVPSLIVGDEGKLRQILFNLVGNAIKFTDSGGVDVQASLWGEDKMPGRLRLVFSVRDTGIGIPEDNHGRVFQTFTQADGSFRRRFGGAGLGLAIVERLVRLMGGMVCLESSPGKGTEMLFSILAEAAAANGKTTKKSLPAERSDISLAVPSLRLLLAEDDKVNQLAIQRLLQKKGHGVLCASSGREAIEMLHKNDVDLILMDIQMPEMDGMEATRAIRDSRDLPPEKRNIPIVALTAHAMEGDAALCLDAGMDGYVAKPVSLSLLNQQMLLALKKE